MLCPKCHNRIVKGSSFCHICGEPIPQQKVEKTILSRVKQKEEIKKEKNQKKLKNGVDKYQTGCYYNQVAASEGNKNGPQR